MRFNRCLLALQAILAISGCFGGVWTKFEPEMGNHFFGWNATSEGLGLQFDSAHPQTATVFGFPSEAAPANPPLPPGCPTNQDQQDLWIAYRAMRRTGGPDWDPIYEPATPWYKWEGVKCPKQTYNLTLHEDYSFSLTHVTAFWNGKLAVYREERHETLPVAEVTQERPSGWGNATDLHR